MILNKNLRHYFFLDQVEQLDTSSLGIDTERLLKDIEKGKERFSEGDYCETPDSLTSLVFYTFLKSRIQLKITSAEMLYKAHHGFRLYLRDTNGYTVIIQGVTSGDETDSSKCCHDILKDVGFPLLSCSRSLFRKYYHIYTDEYKGKR